MINNFVFFTINGVAYYRDDSIVGPYSDESWGRSFAQDKFQFENKKDILSCLLNKVDVWEAKF